MISKVFHHLAPFVRKAKDKKKKKERLAKRASGLEGKVERTVDV